MTYSHMAFFPAHPSWSIWKWFKKKPQFTNWLFLFQGNDETKGIFPSNKGQQWGPNYFHILYLLRWRSGNKTWEYKRERSCKSPTNLASKIHYKRQNGSAGILTSKNKAIINEYNRVWLIFRRKCFADVI